MLLGVEGVAHRVGIHAWLRPVDDLAIGEFIGCQVMAALSPPTKLAVMALIWGGVVSLIRAMG